MFTITAVVCWIVKLLYWHLDLAYAALFQHYSVINNRSNAVPVGLWAQPHDRIVEASTMEEADRCFLELDMAGCPEEDTTTLTVTFLLVLGDEGTGKTHLCDVIEEFAHKAVSTAVIQPM